MDPTGAPYAGGSGRAVLVPSNQTFVVNNYNPVQTPVVISQMDSFGHFSITLTNTSVIQPSSGNPQWQFSFCSQNATITLTCFTMTPMSLTSSQDISTAIQAQAAFLPSSGHPLTLQVNGTNNTVQTLLNLLSGSNVTISDNHSGGVTISASGGTVGSFSSGNLGPLFTTSVANPTSTPALTFSLSTAAANLVFGNCAGTSAVGSYCPLTAAMEPTTTVNSVTNDTNVTGSISAQALTLGWAGTLAVVRGGTGTASPGLVAGSNVTISGSWPNQTINSTGGSGNPPLENCVPDQTGNSFYSVTSLTNWFAGSWQFVPNTTAYINCQVYIQTAQSGATLVLDIYDNDTSGSHTALFQTCDNFSSTTLQVFALTCASAQTWTATGTAYARVQLTFNVQSTLSNNGLLAVKIGVSPSGTQPSNNLIVIPHFIL